MRFIGLDLSLNHTGLAELDSTGRLVNTMEVRPGKHLGVSRLAYLREALLAALPDGPLVVAIEGYAMGAKGRVFHIGEWGGVARLALMQRWECAVVTMPPSNLKSFATGKGNAPKEFMIAAAKAALGYDGDMTDNEADAVHLALVARAWYLPSTLSTEQRRAMQAVVPDFLAGVAPLRTRRRG